jgi:Zn-dependent metalloprotease
MTHGVISSTANLVYADEPGALNEAYADFFGKMIENEGDWTIGKKLFLDPAAAEGFRDMKEPGRIQYTVRNDSGRLVTRPYPTTVAEKATTKKPCDDARNDNCFVHINSTIPGHAFYQLHSKVGKRAAERILYSTLTHFLAETSNFNENAKAMRTACRELYRTGDTCSKLDEVLSLVGFTY